MNVDINRPSVEETAEAGEKEKTYFPTFSEESLDSVIKKLEEDTNNTFGISALMAILSLPEEEFSLLSEEILNEQEKALNNIDDKLLMVQAINASGMKVEDFEIIFHEMMEGVESSFMGQISQQKIDFLKRYLGLMVEAISSTEGVAKRITPCAISYCHQDAKQPQYAHTGDAGMDIYAVEDVTISPGETVLIPTGIKVALPIGYELQVRPRSGVSLQSKLRIANSPGTIDCNYRDEIKIIIDNVDPPIRAYLGMKDGEPIFEFGAACIIEKGTRIAQLVLSEKPMCLFQEVDDVGEIKSDRSGGFGSTGK